MANNPSDRPTAVVTGGSTGIGLAICRSLLAQGFGVISLARRTISLSLDGFQQIAVDLSDTKATQTVAQELAARQPASVIVHNAGATRERLLQDMSLEDLDVLTHLHLTAAIALAQANLPAMKAAGFGRIVLISSRAMLGLQKRTAYSATKAGMVGMARTWSLELAPHGITVNVVAPGPIAETEMFDKVLGDDQARREKLAMSIPVRRLGSPADVAHAVDFFISPRSGFITGQCLLVCGGASVSSLSI